jgi:hypothetical protein
VPGAHHQLPLPAGTPATSQYRNGRRQHQRRGDGEQPNRPEAATHLAIAACIPTAAEITGSEVVLPDSTWISNQPYHAT